ncbi:MAG: bifunctional folylpolyglutamate synthase/dihydrofolate synthase [Nitriliruptoraceae bacterium]
MPPDDHPEFQRAYQALLARGPGRMVPDLERITSLLELLGDPQRAYPSVHVTGTNGKGSVVRMVGSLCSAAGLSAGSFTSPHLQTVRERFGLAGRPIGPERFAEVYDEVAPLADLVDQRLRERDGADADQLTFFELLTAMASWWFADAPVDVGVFEVGMGGSWDATNLVRGEVAVINTIDVDHAELGATPEETAREKVGIIKPGAHVVSAEQRPEVARLVESSAEEAGARLSWLGDDLEVVSREVAVGGQRLALRIGERTIDDILLPLFGSHQADNAALALGAFAGLTGAAFEAMDDEVVRHGLGAVQVPGRLEVVHRNPTVVLDGAHNAHGARAAAAALEESFGFRELVLVAACLGDKDVEAILSAFRDAASHVVVTRAPSPRAAPLEQMQAAALAVWGETGVVVETAVDLGSALSLAETVAREGDGVLVVGSLTTVGSARDRYLPLIDDEPEEVVVAPEDEPEAVDEQDLDALSALLEDDDELAAALEDLDEGDDPAR